MPLKTACFLLIGLIATASICAQEDTALLNSICVKNKKDKVKAIIPEGAPIALWLENGLYLDAQVYKISKDRVQVLVNSNSSIDTLAYSFEEITYIRTRFKKRRNTKIITVSSGICMWAIGFAALERFRLSTAQEETAGTILITGFFTSIAGAFFYHPQTKFTPSKDQFIIQSISSYKIASLIAEKKMVERIRKETN